MTINDQFTPDTAFNWRMNEGHINRKGHPIEGYYERHGAISTLIRTCCNPED